MGAEGRVDGMIKNKLCIVCTIKKHNVTVYCTKNKHF